jgi:diguanylate cyclase (GGDEF)-like protein
VLFLDLDHFKNVNDTLGHAAGDELLVTCAERVRSCIRATDLAGRLGGDEFAVILDGPDATRAVQIADRILERMREPVLLRGHEIVVSASIGIAYAEGEVTAEDLLRNADLAMYCAKTSGRSCHEIYDDSMHDRAIEHLRLEADLRQAIAQGAITVMYQPIVSINHDTVRGVEALARWDHPTRGPIPPASFIPLAERTGLIGALGRHVLDQVCKTAKRLHAVYPDLDVAFNVSAVQLQDPTLPRTIASAFAEAGVDPNRFVLEITESALMHDLTAVVERLLELKQTGVRVAIDDFGVGQSSLSYLRNLPVDVLKIDKSFIDVLPDGGATLARAMVQLGALLGLDVVAEGVESVTQLEELRGYGCQHVQGYLFARPLSEDHLCAELATRMRPWQVVGPERAEASTGD